MFASCFLGFQVRFHCASLNRRRFGVSFSLSLNALNTGTSQYFYKIENNGK